jgi:cell division septation protein DedD
VPAEEDLTVPETLDEPEASEPVAAVSPEPDSMAPAESDPQASEPEEITLLEAPPSQESEAEAAPQVASGTVAAPAAEDSEPVAQGNWMVQVASFSSAETAERIRAQLEQLGHRADSDLLVRGDTRLHRVWTGPYPERTQAERARSQIAATVRDVEPIVKTMSNGNGSAPGAAAGPVFSVQVGVFAEQANAQRQSDQLVSQGFEAFMYHDETGSRPVWRVRVGRYPDRDQAEVLLGRLSAEASLEGLIVTHP